MQVGTILGLTIGLLPLAAHADEQALARSLAATCANCHGTDGRSATKVVEPLAGKKKEDIVNLMQAFKAGSKPATVMHQLSKGNTDQQTELVAAYFAMQKR